MDRYENRGKRNGAYSSGCYDSPPYILLNYEENNINSLYTLIHEAGHSMHSYFSKKYHQLLEAYFGDTLVLDAELSLECLRIPHFYSAFYVYKYATGLSAAIALADKVVNEGETARKAYLNFLKLGGSKFPLDELQDAGVDMRSPEPVKLAIQHFGQLVDKLIKVYKVV